MDVSGLKVGYLCILNELAFDRGNSIISYNNQIIIRFNLPKFKD